MRPLPIPKARFAELDVVALPGSPADFLKPVPNDPIGYIVEGVRKPGLNC
jgi:hypothetical protein